MPRAATRFSRVSIGWASSTQSLVDMDAGDTGGVFSVGGGANIADIRDISTITASVDFGSVSPHDSSTVTVGFSNLTRGDEIRMQPDSIWSGAYFDLSLTAVPSGTTVGELTVAAANSTLTAVDPDAAVFRFTKIAYGSYI